MGAKITDFADISADEIIWTLKSADNVGPFLDEHFPERKHVENYGYMFTVRGGTLYVTGKRIIFKELS